MDPRQKKTGIPIGGRSQSLITCYAWIKTRLCLFCLLSATLTIYGQPLQAAYIKDTPYTDYQSLEPQEQARSYATHWDNNVLRDVGSDFRHYFAVDRLPYLGAVFLGGGLLANTHMDQSIHQYWQNRLRSKSGDKALALAQHFGGLSYYYVPLYLVSMGLGHWREHSEFGNIAYHWGYRSFRTAVLGGVQQALFTYALGSGRPIRHESSKWQPFKNNTGVSGHAFYGAVPFLTAALMTDPPMLRYALYFCSALPGIARIHYDHHYTSQVFLGWSIAALSALSVYQSDSEREPKFQVSLQARSGGALLSGSFRF